MRTKLRLWWQKIKQYPFITVGIVVALLAVIIFMLAVLVFGWDWTGFTGGESKITITNTSKGITTAKELQPGKTLWDWLQLLAALAIPVVVGFGAVWFTTRQGKVSAAENKDNQRETALQAYIDKISELLLIEHLGELTADGKLQPNYDQARKIARVRTITILFQLDARRIGYVFAFLRETGLISNTLQDNIVSLKNADLKKINLSEADLHEANLSEADLHEANLTGAYLTGANLRGADLDEAHLRGANLRGADLDEAHLRGADLRGADFYKANLTEANLTGANLTGAYLRKANLSGANFYEANLTEAHLREANLSGANFYEANLTGAYLGEAILDNARISQEQLAQTNKNETSDKQMRDFIQDRLDKQEQVLIMKQILDEQTSARLDSSKPNSEEQTS